MEKALFPIGHLDKPEVRRIASEQGLATAQRKDSQGICFVGKVDLPVFLQQKLAAKKGDTIEISALWEGYSREKTDMRQMAEPFVYRPEDGVKVGEHNGAHFYTIGQRKGINIGGKPEPLFVIGTDVERNVLYVGQSQHHPGLFRDALFMKKEEIHWIRPDLALQPGESKRFLIRIRYRQPLQGGVLYMEENGGYICFDNPQRGVTAGQFAAWYETDGELIGSGVIDR